MVKGQSLELILNNRPCLQSIDIDISHNGITAIVGPNGAGKSIFIKVIAGLLTPSAGYIKTSVPSVGWVPQSPVLLDRSVRKNIELPLQTNKTDHVNRRTDAALAWANIEKLADLPARSLSLGQQQLVALARAWALEPQLLLLDEPCASLDPQRQQHIEQLLLALNQEGCKIVMSSHLLSQTKRLAEDIIFLDSGQLITHCRNSDFFNYDGNATADNKAGITPAIRQQIEAFIQYA